MKVNMKGIKVLLLVGALVVVVATVLGVITAKNSAKQREAAVGKQVKTLPPVSSKVQNVEVLAASLERAGAPDATAAVEVRNNSNLDITSITLVCGEGGVIDNGLFDPDNPRTIIAAYETKTLKMNLSEMTPGCSLQVGGVTYSDGSEEGLQTTLESMRSVRAHDKAEHDARKGAPKQ